MSTINDVEYDHGDCDLQMDQVSYEFEDAKYSAPRETGEGHGNQRMPAYHTKGRCKFEAEIKVRMHVWLAMKKQLEDHGGGVYDYNPTFTLTMGQGDDAVTDTLVDCQLLDITPQTSEGVAAEMLTIPLRPKRIKFNGKTPFKEAGAA